MHLTGQHRPGEKIVVHVKADLREIIPGYFVNRRKDIVAIGDALKKCDYEFVKVKGHNIAGTGGWYGFKNITDIGYAIQQAAMERKDDEIRQLLDQLLAFLDHVEVVFI